MRIVSSVAFCLQVLAGPGLTPQEQEVRAIFAAMTTPDDARRFELMAVHTDPVDLAYFRSGVLPLLVTAEQGSTALGRFLFGAAQSPGDLSAMPPADLWVAIAAAFDGKTQAGGGVRPPPAKVLDSRLVTADQVELSIEPSKPPGGMKLSEAQRKRLGTVVFTRRDGEWYMDTRWQLEQGIAAMRDMLGMLTRMEEQARAE